MRSRFNKSFERNLGPGLQDEIWPLFPAWLVLIAFLGIKKPDIFCRNFFASFWRGLSFFVDSFAKNLAGFSWPKMNGFGWFLTSTQPLVLLPPNWPLKTPQNMIMNR